MTRASRASLVVVSFVLMAAACGVGGSGTGADGPAPSPPPANSADAASAQPNRPSPPPAPPPVISSCQGLSSQPLDKTWTLDFGGQTRTFYVHVPASYDPTKPMPLVFNFHGFTSNAQQEELLTGMTQKADTAGFIAVHPEGLGTPQSWNAGACCGYAAQSNVDDVGFVGAMLDALEAQICVDSHRVYATGMSNGGFLSHRLGCELSTRIAAVAPVAGVLGVPACTPTRPVPIMEFHGTLDPLVPYNGSTVLGFPSVPDTFSGWAARDGCTGMPVQTYDNLDSHCATYESCAGGEDVTLCTVDGGGHTWPGGLPVPGLGYTTPNLSATDAMWDFFTKHPLP